MADVAVIGIGRVGLPLALSLSSKGLKVVGLDINEHLINLINKRTMPFEEPGYGPLLERVDFRATNDYSKISQIENIVITVGTPLLSHIETDLSQLKGVLEEFRKYLSKGQNIILRSTVAPGTTDFVKKYLEAITNLRVGREIFLSFCPERIMEGKAMEELESLPQIIGSRDEKSADLAEELFGVLVEEILHTDYISAELIKLFNNISRYVRFGLANEFAVITEEFGVNIFDIIKMANHKYPRDKIAWPGLTAGTCLRKDFGMLNENIPYLDILLSAWKINEYMPKFLVEKLKERTSLIGKKISILGYTFKKDTDDTRDSLVPKLIRYLEREVPGSIKIYDPYLKIDKNPKHYNPSLNRVLAEADIVFITVNHSGFIKNYQKILAECKKDTWIIDIWNVCQRGQIFFKVTQ